MQRPTRLGLHVYVVHDIHQKVRSVLKVQRTVPENLSLREADFLACLTYGDVLQLFPPNVEVLLVSLEHWGSTFGQGSGRSLTIREHSVRWPGCLEFLFVEFSWYAYGQPRGGYGVFPLEAPDRDEWMLVVFQEEVGESPAQSSGHQKNEAAPDDSERRIMGYAKLFENRIRYLSISKGTIFQITKKKYIIM